MRIFAPIRHIWQNGEGSTKFLSCDYPDDYLNNATLTGFPPQSLMDGSQDEFVRSGLVQVLTNTLLMLTQIEQLWKSAY
jgi:hypothetical protein